MTWIIIAGVAAVIALHVWMLLKRFPRVREEPPGPGE